MGDGGLEVELDRVRAARGICVAARHLPGQLGVPQTVVLADELTPTAVLAGLQAGRSWIAASRDIELTLTASAGARMAGIGEVLQAEEVVVAASVRGVALGRVSFHAERGRIHLAALPPSGTGEVIREARASEAGLIRVQVRGGDGAMAALTDPVLLTSGTGRQRPDVRCGGRPGVCAGSAGGG
jgi:hypothetical protein